MQNGGNVRAKIMPFKPCLFRVVFRYRLRLSLNIRRFSCLVRRAAIPIIYINSRLFLSFSMLFYALSMVLYRFNICHRNLTIAQALKIRAKEKASRFRLPLLIVFCFMRLCKSFRLRLRCTQY